MPSTFNTDQLVVITGAAGFIGSALVKHLNDQGMTNLVLVDDLETSAKWKNLRNKKFLDFLAVNELSSWLKGKEREVQAIIHLGAISDTLESDGDLIMQRNYRFTVNLAEYALDNDIRFIYASSAATYGDGSLGFSDDHDMIDQLKPLNLYGFSKHLFDLWAKRQGILNKIVGLKYFNVFGPNENHKGRMASMVYKMTPIVKEKGVIELFKSSEPDRFDDGGQCRDFIYVKDAVKMTADFLNNNHGGIFNIGYGVPTTWNQLASAVFKASDKPAKINYVPMPQDLIKQYQNYTCAEMGKYFKTHGYSKDHVPFDYSVEEGVIDYVRNYLVGDKHW